MAATATDVKVERQARGKALTMAVAIAISDGRGEVSRGARDGENVQTVANRKRSDFCEHDEVAGRRTSHSELTGVTTYDLLNRHPLALTSASRCQFKGRTSPIDEYAADASPTPSSAGVRRRTSAVGNE